jgi:hypothetical protein
MVPFMFAVLLLEQLLRRLIATAMPVARTGTPAGTYVTLGLFAFMIAGLLLSLWPARKGQ